MDIYSPGTVFARWVLFVLYLINAGSGDPAPVARIRSSGSYRSRRDAPQSRQYYGSDYYTCFNNCVNSVNGCYYYINGPTTTTTTTTTTPWWITTTTTPWWVNPPTTTTSTTTTTDTTTTTSTTTTTTTTTAPSGRKKRAYDGCPDYLVNNCAWNCQYANAPTTTTWWPTTPGAGWGPQTTTTAYHNGQGWGAPAESESGFSLDIVKFIQSLGQKGSKLYNFFR